MFNRRTNVALAGNDNLYATFATYRVAKSFKRERQSSKSYQASKRKCCMTKCYAKY